MKTPEEIAKEITDQYRRIFVLHGFHLDSIASEVAAAIAKERAEAQHEIEKLQAHLDITEDLVTTLGMEKSLAEDQLVEVRRKAIAALKPKESGS